MLFRTDLWLRFFYYLKLDLPNFHIHKLIDSVFFQNIINKFFHNDQKLTMPLDILYKLFINNEIKIFYYYIILKIKSLNYLIYIII